MRQDGPEPRGEVLRWVEGYAESLLAEDALSEFTRRVDAQVAAEVPEIGADAALRRDLDASTHDVTRAFLIWVRSGSSATLEPPPASRDLGRTLAQRRQDVRVLLRVYRVGQRVFWREFMGVVGQEIADADLRMAVLDFLWDRLSRSLEHIIEQVVAAYAEEERRQLRGALTRRVEATHAILRGDAVDVDTASTRLAHNLHRYQTGLVLWATDGTDDPDPIGSLEALAEKAAAAVDAAHPLTVQSGARTLWAWLATGPDPDLRAIPSAPGLRVAVGVPAPGVAGFRESHREAVLAQGLMAETGAGGQVTLYRDVEVVCCLSADPTAMRAMVARELAGLTRPDAVTARLRETVAAYYAAGGSARAAADALGLHKNTVLYRLRQAEELLGHGIDERRLPLELALMLAAAHGDRVLPEHT
jgi:DNA-binding PucR family transcriptional regulator